MSQFFCPGPSITPSSRRYEPPPVYCAYTDPVPFTEHAGFPHAMHGNRDPIRVAPNPAAAPALDYLNDLAGWRLWVFSNDDPEITWEVHERNLWGALWNGPGPYTKVIIYTPMSANATNVAGFAHEMMHALGYDHTPCGVLGREGISNPHYDRALLFQEGYRTAPLPPPPPPGEATYWCPCCGKVFTSRRKLKRHARRRHRLKEGKC